MKHTTKELPKDQKSLIQLAKDQGWEWSKTSGGHHRLISPDGEAVVTSGTPSDYRAVKNFRAQLKRAGLLPFVEMKKVSEEKAVAIHSTVVPMKKKRKTNPGLRGGRLRDTLVEVLRKNDAAHGVSTARAAELASAVLGMDIPKSTVNSTLNHWKDYFARVGYGHYRVTELAMASVKESAPAAAEEDDEKVLIEFLVALDKVANIVKRHIELQKALAGVMQKLGTTK